MNGPEHFLEAEWLLRYANRHDAELSNPGHRFADVVAEAQVHATLALAAATSHLIEPDGSGFIAEWRDAEGRKPEAF